MSLTPSFSVLPQGHIPPGAAHFVVYGLLIAAPLACLALLIAQARAAGRRAQLADAKYDAHAPLVPGPAILFGKVEHAPGETVAVRVDIRQTGSETVTKGNWSHTWQEIDRKLVARPFYIVRDDGTRVRVEPGDEVELIDQPDEPQWQSRELRTLSAELVPDEGVYAVGELVPGRDPLASDYRGSPSALVLKAPRGGKLELSARSLGERYRQQASSTCLVLLGLVAFVIVSAVMTVGFTARVLFGERTAGVVTSIERISGKTPRCKLAVTTPSGARIDEDLDGKWCPANAPPPLKPGDSVPVVQIAGSSWFAQVGASPSVSGAIIVPAIGGFVLLVLGYVKRARPWYEAKVVTKAEGRLPEPP